MPYNAQGQWVAEQQSDQPAPSEFDSAFGQYIPLDLLGSRGRVQAGHDAQAADQNRGYWDSLSTPSASQLTDPRGESAQQQALSQLQQWSQGGLTGTDRAQLESTRQRDAQAAGSAQRSLMQQAQARGVGGSGLDYATRQQAAQLGQQQASDAESAAMTGAQQRALSATGAAASLGHQMRGDAASSVQQAYEDAASRAAGATGQYGTDSSARQSSRDRQQRSDTSLVGLLASL